jgi:rhodanese-related sulfurtransferase
MFNFFKNLFKQKPSINFQELVQKGAIIVDVRTPGEFMTGHIKGALNIPINTLVSRLNTLPKNKPLITCCASGMRSATGRQILISKGYEEVYNGGPWTVLNKKLNG